MGVWKSDHTVITAKGMQLLSDLAGKKPLDYQQGSGRQ